MTVTIKGGKQYDFSLVRTDGTTEVGFMLDTDRAGKKRYERVTDPTLAQQFFSGDPSYGNLPPEKEFSLIGSNHEAGFGLEFADSVGANKYRYYTSVGADCRFKDNVICGPVATALTLVDYTATITDGGLEAWDDANNLTSWPETISGAGPTLVRDGANQRSDTYCAQLTSTAAHSIYIGQSLAWDTKYQSKTVEVKCWVNQDTANAVVLQIYDGVGTTSGAQSATTGSYVQLSCARALNAAATELTIRVFSDVNAGGPVTFVDDITWSYPIYATMLPAAHAQFNNELYIGYGSVLVKLNGAGDGFTFVNSFADSTIYSLETYTDNSMYIALGSAAYQYMATAETFTTSNLGGADQTAKLFRNVNGVMYKWISGNTISKAADPANGGSWSTASTVGTQDEDILSISSIAGTPYIGKYDMPFYLSTTDADFPITEDVQFLGANQNCKSLAPWHGSMFIADVGRSGIIGYDGTTVTWRSPSRFSTNLPDYSTQVLGLAGDEEYLYALLGPDTGTLHPVLAGQLRSIDGTTQWVWHPIQHIDTTAAGVNSGSAFISDVVKKRYYFAHYSSPTAKLYYIPLTKEYGDITGDSTYAFKTGGYVITPWLHANLKGDSKGFHQLTLTTEGCNATNYITVAYQTYYTALTGTWTSLGNFTTSPSQTRYFSSNNTGTMIRFRFTLVTSATTTTPTLTNYDCRGIWRPAKRQLISCVVKLGDDILPKNGTQPSDGYKSMRDAINEAVDQVAPNTFYDIDSTSKSVNLLYAREFDVELAKGINKPTSKFELLFEEITTS